jgi:hypothetical protein
VSFLLSQKVHFGWTSSHYSESTSVLVEGMRQYLDFLRFACRTSSPRLLMRSFGDEVCCHGSRSRLEVVGNKILACDGGLDL